MRWVGSPEVTSCSNSAKQFSPGAACLGSPHLADQRLRPLARLLRLGEVVAVAVPTQAQEAARDLVRAREDVRGDLMRARHRTSKLLLGQGIVWSGGTAWTEKHHQWLRRQSFERRALKVAYDSALEAVLLPADRRDRLDEVIVEMAADPAWSPIVARLSCLRGVSTLTAFGLAVEVGDWSRFTCSRIGAFLGLVPTESSSGQSRSQGSITETGNTHARRRLALVGTPATSGYTSGARRSRNATSASRSRTWRSPGSSPGGAGRWPRWRRPTPRVL